MDPVSLAALAALIGTILGSLVAAFTIREKLWPKPATAHPLEASLRDIALALREQAMTGDIE